MCETSGNPRHTTAAMKALIVIQVIGLAPIILAMMPYFFYLRWRNTKWKRGGNMKIVVKLAVILMVSSVAMAGGYGQPGPKGDKGDKGDPGQSIVGPAGSNGADGQDSTGGWKGYGGAGLRVLDSRYASLNAFGLKDVRNQGGIAGVMVMVTPWKSAADRRMDALEKRLNAQDRVIADQERMIVKMRAERGAADPYPVYPGSVTDPDTQTLTIRGR